jgi:phage shock protein PspC (stress-responsive transcriptional regulator)
METGPGTVPPPDYTPHRAPRRLFRSSTNRVFAGVCGGIAEYFGGDPTMVRLATAFLGLITGIVPMLILYIVAAIVVPERGPYEAVDPAAYPRPAVAGNGALIVGMIFIVVGLAAFFREVLRVDWDLVWPLALIGIGAAFVLLTFRR